MRARKDETGAFAVLFGITAAGLLLICALVVDLGLARDAKGAQQHAADASSLAAANALYPSGTTPDYEAAVNAAKAYALANYDVPLDSWDACTDPGAYHVPVGSTPCVSFVLKSGDVGKPEKVRVVMPTRTVHTGFGKLAGISDIDISATARATLSIDQTQPCGLCVLGPGNHNFQNGDATVGGADIYINGSSSVSNQGLVATDGAIYVEGNAAGGLGQYDPDPVTGVPAITDPLAHIALPPDMSGLLPQTNPCVDGPGIYTGRNLRNATCNLSPGLYVVRAGTWDLAGNANTHLNGTGVTIYFTCSTGTTVRPCDPGESGATFDASGNGNISLKGPTTGPLAGLTIVMDRNNASELRLTGNGTLGTTGAVYAKSAKLRINGNGCGNGISSMIVVDDVEFNGNPSCLNLVYSEGQNPKAAPTAIHLDQ